MSTASTAASQPEADQTSPDNQPGPSSSPLPAGAAPSGGSAHAAGSAVPPAPDAAPPQAPTAQSHRSPEEIAAELEARRRALAADVDEVAARLAPTSLKRLARRKADAAVADLRSRTESLREQAESLASQAGLTQAPHTPTQASHTAQPATTPGGQAGTPSSEAPAHRLASLPQRLSRLIDDARDGDPASLAIVTGVALALAGVSALALTRAVRSQGHTALPRHGTGAPATIRTDGRLTGSRT